MNLSKDFTLKEFVHSATAKRNGINNEPDDIHIKRLETLCVKVLQPAREYFKTIYGLGGSFIKITSGYRCKELTLKLGSTTSSFHYFGYAADCELYILDNVNDKWIEANHLFFNYIKDHLPFTELIWEYGTKKMPDWVHIAYNPSDERSMVKHIG